MASVSELIEFYLNENRKKIAKKSELLRKRYGQERDPWGLNIDTLQTALTYIYPLYDKYFRVKLHGLENLPKKKNFIVIANHSGQIPIDGALIITSLIMEKKNPILLRGMGERFMFQLPFLAKIVSEAGTILGDRKNCRYLLERGHSILVFPEGVKGITKSTEDFYKLQKFTNGFYRLALEQDIPIVPITVIGAEEFYPYVHQSPKMAELLNVPSFPITPFFPWFGLLGALPMPSPVDIHIGKTIKPNKKLNKDSPTSEIKKEVQKIKEVIQEKIDKELPKKRKMFE